MERRSSGRSLQGVETILLVEDEAMVRSLMVRALEQHGYTVLDAANGFEALRAVQEYSESKIHLLVTDVVMPQIGGVALAEKLKSADPNLRVLFISGYTDRAIIHSSILGSDIALLRKPFSPDSVIDKVREILDEPL